MQKYIVINEEPNVNILGLDPILKGFHSEELKKFSGKNLSITFYELENDKFRFGAPEKEWRGYSKYLFKKIINDRTFEKNIVRHAEDIGIDIYNLSKQTLSRLRAGEISENERKDIIEKLFSLFVSLCSYGLIGAIISFGDGEASKLMEKFIKKKIKDARKANEYINLLSYRYYESYDQKGLKALANIAQKIYEEKNLKKLLGSLNTGDEIFNKLSEEIKNGIKEYIFEWGWLTYSYRGPEYTIENAIAGIRELISYQVSPETHIKKIVNDLRQNAKKQEQIARRLKLSNKEKYSIQIVKNITYAKELRTKMMFLADFTINELLKPFAKKEKFTMRQMGVCAMKEIIAYFRGRKLPSKEILNSRLKYSLLLSMPGKEKILTGIEAKKWVKDNIKIEKIDKNIAEFFGQIACVGEGGKIRGKVKIVNVAKEMVKFKDGDVLVSIATTPEIVPVMKKAAAIITDLGGITCHAAIVSRELKKPCVIGTKFATKVLRDGDVVEIDMSNGMVSKLNRN